MNQKKRTRAGTIALYVLAVLLLCYGVYMMYSAYDYVSQYYAYQGMDIGSNLAEAVQYMVSQSYLYLCFALLFYVAGVILQKLNDLHACLIPQEQPETADAQEAAAEDTIPETYTVQKGDTLLGISRRIYGRDDQIDAICSLNGIDDSDRILAGQKLLLP